jgi:short-subunit dehydrogenase
VITGASTGIGKAVALALAARGAKVGLIARRDDLLQELAAEIRATNGTAVGVAADVTDRQAVLAAVAKLRDQLGPIDLMFANAGIGEHTGAYEMNVPAVEATMKVNFLGVVYAFESVLADMIQRNRGHLVAVSSMASLKGLPTSAAYSASKAAVNNYCEGLRIELHGTGIAVTSILPGFIATPMTAKYPRKMPWLMTAEEAARRILTALHRKPAVYAFPWQMRVLLNVARWAPDSFVARKVREVTNG